VSLHISLRGAPLDRCPVGSATRANPCKLIAARSFDPIVCWPNGNAESRTCHHSGLDKRRDVFVDRANWFAGAEDGKGPEVQSIRYRATLRSVGSNHRHHAPPGTDLRDGIGCRLQTTGPVVCEDKPRGNVRRLTRKLCSPNRFVSNWFLHCIARAASPSGTGRPGK